MDKGSREFISAICSIVLKSQRLPPQAESVPGSLPVDLRQLKGMRRIREFDDMITAKIHGFADALGLLPAM